MADIATKGDKYDKLMEELKALVKCPVCLSIPEEGPISSCPKGHLVCQPCHQVMVEGNMSRCPTCRQPMGENLSLVAKKLIESIEHNCTNQGCSKIFLNRDLIRHIEELCEFRKVRCPGRSPDCEAEIPFNSFNDHIENCQKVIVYKSGQCQLTFKKGDLNGATINWKTMIFHTNDEVLVVNLKMAEGKFHFSVLMLADKEECERSRVTICLINPRTEETTFSTQLKPMPLSLQSPEEASLVVEGRFSNAGSFCTFDLLLWRSFDDVLVTGLGVPQQAANPPPTAGLEPGYSSTIDIGHMFASRIRAPTETRWSTVSTGSTGSTGSKSSKAPKSKAAVLPLGGVFTIAKLSGSVNGTCCPSGCPAAR